MHAPFSVEAAAENSSAQRWMGQAWACVLFSVTIWGQLKQSVHELRTHTFLLAVLGAGLCGPRAPGCPHEAHCPAGACMCLGAVGKNPQTGRRDRKTCRARRGLPFSGYFLHPPLNYSFVTGMRLMGTGRVRWLRDPTKVTKKQAQGGGLESRERRLHVAGSGRRPVPVGRAELGPCGRERRRRLEGTRPPRVPQSVAVVLRVRPFPGGAGHTRQV